MDDGLGSAPSARCDIPAPSRYNLSTRLHVLARIFLTENLKVPSLLFSHFLRDDLFQLN